MASSNAVVKSVAPAVAPVPQVSSARRYLIPIIMIIIAIIILVIIGFVIYTTSTNIAVGTSILVGYIVGILLLVIAIIWIAFI